MKADILEQLYTEYYNDVLLYSLSLAKDKATAEELAAEAFYRAIESADGEIKNFKAWVLAVCRNSYFAYAKKQSRFTELHEYMSDDGEAVIDKIIRDEEYKALYHAISLLPKDQNEAILLFYFEDLPIKSISMITEKSTAHTKVLLYRARENLRKILEVQL